LLTSGCGGHAAAPAPAAAKAAITLSGVPARIPRRYTCAGAGAKLPLRWRGVPASARELVLVVTDPDAPGGRFVHWTVFGIPPTARSVPASAPSGTNSAGSTGWTPPCPPAGPPHRYVFDLYALARRSGLRSGAGASTVIAAARGAVARGEAVGRL